MTHEEMVAQIEALKAENAQLKEKTSRAPSLTLKVSQKGAVSLYGIGRYPVTLYRQQWERVLGHVDSIRAFIETNADKLSVKE